MDYKNDCNVLVVDDEPIIRMDLVGRLEDEGYLTCEADSAITAIKLLKHSSSIKVVFTDIQMPGSMDGVALAHYVKNRWPPTIIIVSSGRQQPAEGDLPTDVVFIPKPYSSEDLKAVLQKIADAL